MRVRYDPDCGEDRPLVPLDSGSGGYLGKYVPFGLTAAGTERRTKTDHLRIRVSETQAWAAGERPRVLRMLRFGHSANSPLQHFGCSGSSGAGIIGGTAGVG